MEKPTYRTWWCEMIKRWWFYWGIVGFIQLVYWFVPEPVASQYQLFVRLLSVAILLIPLLFWIPYKIWEKAHPEVIKDQQENPSKYVTTHICSIDTYTLESKQGNFIYLNTCFCNALFHDIKLISLSGSAIVNEKESNNLPWITEVKSIELNRGFTAQLLKLNATEEYSDELRMSLPTFERDKPVKIELNLIAYDNKGMEYKLSAIYKKGDIE